MREANRIHALPPYLFAQIEERVAEAKVRGVDVISLGIGDPDLPTPRRVIDALVQEAYRSENHRYPSSAGLMVYREAVSDWYLARFGVELDARSEITTLIGSKEGIANLSFCFLDQGDIALVPDPGYPVYSAGTILAGGRIYKMPLLKENGFLPDLSSIPEQILEKARVMWLNYPNNPTGAVVEREFLEDAVDLARHYDIILCYDAAYTEITFDDYRAPSILEIDGAKEVAVEFHSLSKTYNMTGWRIGWLAGNSKAVGAVRRYKTNIDSGVFQPIQYAAIAALRKPIDPDVIETYKERRDLAVQRLQALGWDVDPPKAGFYLWAEVPPTFDSLGFAEYVFEKTGVVITPGNGYGDYGEGYFRISLCLPLDRLTEAFDRWERAQICY